MLSPLWRDPMEITKELLEQRIAEIEVQKAQFIANVNACGGAITALYQVIADLEKEAQDNDPEILPVDVVKKDASEV